MKIKKILALFVCATLFASGSLTTNAKITNQELKTSVVQIWNMESDGEFYTGSGVIISNDAVILTAAHVIMDETTGEPSTWLDICITVSEYEDPMCMFSGYVMAYDEVLDLALIAPAYELDEYGNEVGEFLSIEEMQALGLSYVDISDYEPALGDEVTILGYPSASNSTTITLTNGVISNFISSGIEGFNGYYVTDATINPGNSGGPVYNEEEKLVGIVSQVSTEGIGGNYGYIIAGDMIYLWFWELVEQGILNESFVSSTFSNDYEDLDTSNIDFGDISDSLESDLNDINFLDTEFTDVYPSTKNAEAINFLKENGIISGYSDGTFKPTNPLNRAELLRILVEGVGYSPDENVYKNCFSDVKEDWYAKYVCFAKEQGWIVGYSDGTFRPANNINKAEAIKMLLEIFLEPTTPPQIGPYTDVPKGEWFAKYVSRAKELGILEETGSTYNPSANITRGQISENIYRMLLLKAS